MHPWSGRDASHSAALVALRPVAVAVVLCIVLLGCTTLEQVFMAEIVLKYRA